MENGVWYILAALIMGWTGFCIYKSQKGRMWVRLHGLPPQREM